MGYQTTNQGERNSKNVLEPLGSLAEQGQQKLVPSLGASPAKLPGLHLPAAPVGSCPWAQRHGDTLQEWSHCTPLNMAQVLFSKGKEQSQSSTVSF